MGVDFGLKLHSLSENALGTFDPSSVVSSQSPTWNMELSEMQGAQMSNTPKHEVNKNMSMSLFNHLCGARRT